MDGRVKVREVRETKYQESIEVVQKVEKPAALLDDRQLMSQNIEISTCEKGDDLQRYHRTRIACCVCLIELADA